MLTEINIMVNSNHYNIFTQEHTVSMSKSGQYRKQHSENIITPLVLVDLLRVDPDTSLKLLPLHCWSSADSNNP